MPLQIRRGTNAERQAMAQPLAAGELLYVTDDQKIYVGNGSTLGGIQITGYTNEDAIDAVGAALVAGSHTGISFTYGLTQDTANRIDATIDLSNYAGTLRSDSFKGTFVADDSTILVDGVAGVLRGTLEGSLTGNVIGNVTGNLIGNVTGNLSGAVTGTVIGDLKGTVVADDSTILVDAVSGLIRGSYDNGSISISANNILSSVTPLGAFENNIINIGTAASPASIDMYSNAASKNYITLTGLGDATDTAKILVRSSRGSVTSPTTMVVGDNVAGFQGDAYDGTDYRTVGRFGLLVDPNSSITGGFVPGTFAALIIDNAGNTKILTFDSKGVLNAPVLKTGTYTVSTRPSTPTAGEIIFVSDASSGSKFQGWDGSSWVSLG